MCLKYIKGNNGLTLIELLVSLAILSIAITSAYLFLFHSNSVYGKGVDQYSVQTNIRLASDYITSQVRYATEVEILDNMSTAKIADPLNNIDAYENYIFYQNGRIVRLSKYSSNSFYIGLGGEIEFSSDSPGKILNFSVKGIDSKQSYFIDSEVKPLNLGVEGNSINNNTNSVIFYRTTDDYLAKTALPEATLGDPNDSKKIEIYFSKGILEDAQIIMDNHETIPAANIENIDIHTIRININDPGATEGRIIVFVVRLDDFGEYEYTLTYLGEWYIE